MGDKLWGGRFSGQDMDSIVLSFTSSLEVDKVLAEYDCLSNKVYTEMLAKCGFVSDKEKKEIISALDEIAKKITEDSFDIKGFEDIHSAIQDYVNKRCPDAAKKMHTGRSRNEQVVNDVRLYCKDKTALVQELIVNLQKGLIELAEKNTDVIIPGYTHLNRAQPVLFAHLIMAYVEMFERDSVRLEGAKTCADISVLGSGAIAGSSLPIDRDFIAKELGFAKISANSIDAVSDRDFIAEFISALSLVSVHLSRICEDFILYSTSEFAFLEIGEKFCTGSSLMPQKKNPDVLELVRGKSAGVISALNTILVLLKGLPHAYNRDLQEDKKPLFESVELVCAELSIMADLMGDVTVKVGAGVEALKEEFIYATDIAEYLVGKGVAFSDAHGIVGNIVKHCIEKGVNISDISISELKKFYDAIEEDIYTLLNSEVSVGNKKTSGSTNPDVVKKEIANWKKRRKR